VPRPNVDRMYDQLKPPERLTLLLEAMARDDVAEAQRLQGSCPRVHYTGQDRRFHDRLDMAFDVVAVVSIDLRCMWGKLRVLDWVLRHVVKNLATEHHITAGLAFIEGEHCGEGLRQLDFFARPLPGPTVVDAAEEGEVNDDEPEEDGSADDEDEDGGHEDEGDDEDDDEEFSEGDLERGRRLAAVQKRAEHVTACSVLALTLAAKDIAQDLVDTWEALGVFCHTRVGVTPETMLTAWQFPVAGEFEETLKRYSKLTPDPQKVKRYTGYICKHWDERFGRRRRPDDEEAGDDGGAEGGDGDGD
jgi:hypothetical protein